MMVKTSLLINPEEITYSWIDKMKNLGYDTLGIHPKAGKKSCEYMLDLVKLQDDSEYQKYIDYASNLGLDIEYECHAIGYLLPRTFFSEHPEYFRMNSSGERVNDYNFCPSNKEALDLVCENAIKLAKLLYKSTHNYYFWCDDVKEESTCMCEKCRKYSESDKNLIIVNAIASKLKSEIKDAKVAYLAYQKTIQVPDTVKPCDNVFLEYAPIDRQMDKPIIKQNEEDIDNIKKLLDYFGKKDSKVLEYWVDNSLFSNWTKPAKEYKPNYEVIKQDIKTYRELGFKYISSFACYLSSDYINLYGEPEIPSFVNIIKKEKNMNKFFSEVKRNFGFGCMRLPMIGEDVDIEQTKLMVDYFIDHGFNYFDTAHGYINKKSELALRDALTSRYPREKYILANKLSDNFFSSEDDIRPLFQEQLNACGVEYFDFYLMHAQNARNYEKYKRCNAYETALKLKEEGKIRHVGMSFHDTCDVLDRILTEKPFVEFVQIQFNYLDYLDSAVQSKKCYDVCVKHNKPVIVMEPIKGGTLINLPTEATSIVDKLGISNANLAVRFAATPDNIFMVLSGMSTIEQMKENVSFMEDFKPLNDEEINATKEIANIFDNLSLIKCTSCRYCVEGCPKHISIPDLFACINAKKRFRDWNSNFYYSIHTQGKGKASDCIKCGKCEKICPQKLNIRELLVEVANTFEKR